MKGIFLTIILAAGMLAACTKTEVANIPLPEHPRPDFERAGFVNLNGYWKFTFDSAIAEGDIASFDREILVPFPWGSKLSEVPDSGDVAWYGRKINIPADWEGQRVFLVVGASDFETSVSIDGKPLGSHRGGYTTFEFELTDEAAFGGENTIILKADDTKSDTHLYGKQGYGNARGIWQTVYLEARGERFIKTLHFSPDIDASKVGVEVTFDSAVPQGSAVAIAFRNDEREAVTVPVEGEVVKFDIDIPNQHLWTLDDPYLYEVTASLEMDGKVADAVDSYFGQRKIGTVKVPGQNYTYISLNNEPLYLQLCLDQSYHPEGFYTFPSDEFMKNEILLSKSLGLNGNRIHIKTEVPRKLYWADKLGLLIMADIPNFWGEPVPEARENWESCMRGQVERDFNHPSIFAWVDFNETWGLFTNVKDKREYLPETQEWVRQMYLLTKQLDPTRLVEDNSACNEDHVQTDINSWHTYLPGYLWESHAAWMEKNTTPGSSFNYIGKNRQTDAPMINSECGNVWGYDGCAGDCDYTWDYHEMMNSFHRHLKIGGWLYTEHHDVINEWNGYVRYDRSPKVDGLDYFVDGMGVKDFHSHYYIVPAEEVCITVPAGSEKDVKLLSSFTTSVDPGEMTLETSLYGWNVFGEKVIFDAASASVPFKPYELNEVLVRKVKVPSENGIYVLSYVLKKKDGDVLSRNFSLFRVKDAPVAENVISFAPDSYSAQSWSVKTLKVMDGLKVNGFGSGYFEYTVAVPAGKDVENRPAELMFEASAKKLLGKDVEGDEIDGDYMLGGGTWDPCKSSNAYSMTDMVLWPSEVAVTVNGRELGTFELADDPADHRGMLSWSAQPREKRMFEAGSYGYLIKADIPAGVLKSGENAVIRFTVPDSAATGTSGGLAIYGKDFGRYPLDPCIVLK